MSLLNDMLHDLAKQKPAKQVTPLLIPVMSKNGKKSMKHFLLLGLALIFFLSLGLVFPKMQSQPVQLIEKKTISIEDASSENEIKPQLVKEVNTKSISYTSYIEPFSSSASHHVTFLPSEFASNEMSDNVDTRGEPSSSSVHKVYSPQTLDEWHDAQLTKALAAIDQGFDEEAKRVFQNILVKIPGATDAIENLASLYLADGDYTHAREILNKGLESAPVNAALITMKARLFLDQNNAKNAIKLLSSHHPSITDYPDFYATLAAAFQMEGRVLEAGSIYKSLLQVDPNNGQYWLGYAISLELHNKSHQAIEAYTRATQDPGTEISVREYAEDRLKTLQG